MPPPDCLRDYVDHFWSIESLSPPDGQLVIRTIADNTSGIVFQHHQGNTAFSKKDGMVGTSLVFGQKDRAVECSTSSPFSMTAAQFKPWALCELLGTDPSALTNGLVDLNEFFGEDVNQRLLENGSAMGRVSLLTRFLVGKLPGRIEPDRLVRHALEMIHANPGFASVPGLLEYYDISDRQFERRFKQTVGVTPIFYIRVNRFNEGLRRIRSGRYVKLSDVAYSLNYSDQSHFIKDFNAFSGQPPSQLTKLDSALPGLEKFKLVP